MDRAQPRLLYPSIALAIVVFSLSAILVRFADEAPGLAIAVWRTWIAVLLLTPFMLRQRQRQPFAFSRKDKWFILVAGVLLGLHFVTWIESIHHTSIASATVILSTTPVFVAIGGFLFLKERFKLSTSVGILLALVGSVVIAWSDFTTAANTGDHPYFGNSLALMAALTMGAYMLVGRAARKGISWLYYVYPLYVVAASTTLVCALLLRIPLFGYSPLVYGLCALMAIGPQIIGHGSFNFALRYVSPTILALLSLLEPIGASIIAAMLFGEIPTPLALGGMVLVLLAVAYILWFRRSQST